MGPCGPYSYALTIRWWKKKLGTAVRTPEKQKQVIIRIKVNDVP